MTAAVDDLEFLHPIKVGDLIILNARVTCTFTTSIEVRRRRVLRGGAHREPSAHEPRVPHVRRHRFQGARVAVPPLRIDTAAERQVCEQARARREQRLKRRVEQVE